MSSDNPKIIHRIYFPEFRPFHDPFEHYLETWKREMPDYDIKIWNSSNLDVYKNEWTTRAFNAKSPVFLSEYFRWEVLQKFGGLYLDADCEILDGRILRPLIDELYSQDEYDTFFGVEEKSNGHPTAQTVGAHKTSELVGFMKRMYDESLSGPLWQWRERRGLIGPQLMALYFLEQDLNKKDDGFFKNLDEAVVLSRCKVYPQNYFSPKFTLLGETIDYNPEKTCIYHMFANSNLDFTLKPRHQQAQARPLLFKEYQEAIAEATSFPRIYRGDRFETQIGEYDDDSIVSKGVDGVLCFGPYVSLGKGDYVAVFNLEIGAKQGSIEFTITADHGNQILTRRREQISQLSPSKFTYNFSVSVDTNNIEFLVASAGVGDLRFNSVKLDFAPFIMNKEAAGSLKILHRIYFGFDGKPDPFSRYLQTWKDQLPNFQIIHWNATNLPMGINEYVINLHKQRDHAFLTDYFRWYVLREHGGVYFDADVEVTDGHVFNQLVGELEIADKFDAFIGIDEANGGWYTAHSMASKPNSALSRFMCDIYDNFGSFIHWRKRGLYFWAPQLVALYFASTGHNVDGMGTSPRLTSPNVSARVKIYPQDWFSPISPTGVPESPFAIDGLSANTCICHHFACSWHDDNSIYLSHSKKRGGQSGVLLRELIKIENSHYFEAQSEGIKTQVGENIDGKIHTTGRVGYLVYGPGVAMSAGDYRVTFLLSDIDAWGDVTIDMTDQSGRFKILERGIAFSDIKGSKIIQLVTLTEKCQHFECRILVDQESTFSFNSITIAPVEEEEPSSDVNAMYFGGSSESIRTEVGQLSGDVINTTGRSGFFTYGPMVAMEPGHYRVTLSVSDVVVWGHVTFDMVDESGTIKMFERGVAFGDLRDGKIVQELSLERSCQHFECRLIVDDTSKFSFHSLVIEQLA